ncbi:MAG: 3-oxoacyl-[acyl-carrier-protein] reductase [Acidobacteriota bacterium]
MFSLEGRTALVTGASQGIGAEIARALAARGAAVLVAARSADKLAALADEIQSTGGRAHALSLDLADAEGIAAAIKALPEDWSAVDVLVNNAGITADGLFLRMKLEQWQSVLDTNLTGTFALTKEIVKGMIRRRYGRIVQISSVVGLMGNPGQTNYAASKAGLIGFSKSLAREIGGRGVTVNVVAPGYIETAMTEQITDKAREELVSAIVLGRMGNPGDIASAVVYLSSEEAGYVTGEVLNVSGGLYI